MDEERALAWYQRAAGEGGSDIAQSRLGEMYQHGIGVPKDELKAVEWFQKAAEQGSSLGQCCLGEVSREERSGRGRGGRASGPRRLSRRSCVTPSGCPPR